VYNALNQRVRAVVSGTATEFVFNTNGQRVSVWDGSSRTQLRGQYYWGGKPVAFYAGGATHFQHQDWLGTERMRTGYNGGVEAAFTSLPFGDAQTTASGSDLDPYHFAALDHDSETSTDHAQFRQYNNTQGRWLSPDPYSGSYDVTNPQSMNRYVYALNNPLSSIDPSGLYLVYLEWGDGKGGSMGGWFDSDALIAAGFNIQFGSNGDVSSIDAPANGVKITDNDNVIGTISADTDLSAWAGNITSSIVVYGDPTNSSATISITTNFPALRVTAPNNTPHTAVAGSVAFPIAPGVVGDIPFVWIPSTGKVCIGIGGGTGSPGVNAGGVYSSANIENVLSGASVSVAAQSGALGGQTIQNNSGIAVGNSMGSPGASLTVTYSWCF
jgi:RHS repeat-associated protein